MKVGIGSKIKPVITKEDVEKKEKVVKVSTFKDERNID